MVISRLEASPRWYWLARTPRFDRKNAVICCCPSVGSAGLLKCVLGLGSPFDDEDEEFGTMGIHLDLHKRRYADRGKRTIKIWTCRFLDIGRQFLWCRIWNVNCMICNSVYVSESKSGPLGRKWGGKIWILRKRVWWPRTKAGLMCGWDDGETTVKKKEETTLAQDRRTVLCTWLEIEGRKAGVGGAPYRLNKLSGGWRLSQDATGHGRDAGRMAWKVETAGKAGTAGYASNSKRHGQRKQSGSLHYTTALFVLGFDRLNLLVVTYNNYYQWMEKMR